MKKVLSSVRQFCLIQLQVLKDREQKLRKELLDCKIQSEYLTSVLQEVAESCVDADLSKKYKDE